MSKVLDPAEQAVLSFPRRSRRKQETRQRIVDAAEVLFRQAGFTTTTMQAIAEAADVHVTTLFTHFKSKRDLSDAISERVLEAMGAAIAESRGKRRFFDFMRKLTENAGREHLRRTEQNIAMGRLFGADEEFTASWIAYERRKIEMLADYIAEDFGLDIALDYRPTLIANMIVGGNIMVHQRWVESEGGIDLVAESLAVLEAVETLVKRGLAPLGREGQAPMKTSQV